MTDADRAGCVIRFELARPTPLLNVTLRQHWRKAVKAKRALAWEVRLAIGRQAPPAPFGRALVRIERHSLGQPDYDGMVGGMKSLIDCLLPQSKAHPTGLGIITDDNQRAMTLQAVSVRVLRRDDQKTIVIIREIENDIDPACENNGVQRSSGRLDSDGGIVGIEAATLVDVPPG